MEVVTNVLDVEKTSSSQAKRGAASSISELEAEINRLTRELENQKRAARDVSEELESFSYSISHDLRAPLRHLVGFSSALAEDYGETLEPTALSYLDCIVRAGRKMEILIEALLGLSRLARQEMSVTDVDLGMLARHCADALREREPQRQVNLKIAEGMKVQGDMVLLRNALEQLLANAWKFTGNNSCANIEIGCQAHRGSTVYYVRDDGAGFDTRYAERLFAPFQRMHREDEFPGVGIGLSTAQRIIHRHNGRIWAEAEVGAGATFFFTLWT